MRRMQHLLQTEYGASLAEYALLLFFVVAACIIAIQTLGETILNRLYIIPAGSL